MISSHIQYCKHLKNDDIWFQVDTFDPSERYFLLVLYKDQKLDSFQYKWVNGSIVWACGPKLLRLGPSLCLIRPVQTAWRNCHKQNQWSFRTVICGLCRTCEEVEVITFCVHLRKSPKMGFFLHNRSEIRILIFWMSLLCTLLLPGIADCGTNYLN